MSRILREKREETNTLKTNTSTLDPLHKYTCTHRGVYLVVVRLTIFSPLVILTSFNCYSQYPFAREIPSPVLLENLLIHFFSDPLIHPVTQIFIYPSIHSLLKHVLRGCVVPLLPDRGNSKSENKCFPSFYYLFCLPQF